MSSRARAVLQSPFRYAGGKSWLVPEVRRWLLAVRPRSLVEPFAGGASVSLAAVSEGLVDRAVLVERDDDIAAVWQTVLGEDVHTLARRIRDFTPTAKAVAETVASEDGGTVARAFRVLVRNRVSRGGLLAPGAGLLRAGEKGRGLASRCTRRRSPGG